MDRSTKFAPPPPPTSDRRAELLARLEATLRADARLSLRDDRGGLDPYNTLNGPQRRDAWGARAR